MGAGKEISRNKNRKQKQEEEILKASWKKVSESFTPAEEALINLFASLEKNEDTSDGGILPGEYKSLEDEEIKISYVAEKIVAEIKKTKDGKTVYGYPLTLLARSQRMKLDEEKVKRLRNVLVAEMKPGDILNSKEFLDYVLEKVYQTKEWKIIPKAGKSPKQKTKTVPRTDTAAPEEPPVQVPEAVEAAVSRPHKQASLLASDAPAAQVAKAAEAVGEIPMKDGPINTTEEFFRMVFYRNGREIVWYTLSQEHKSAGKILPQGNHYFSQGCIVKGEVIAAPDEHLANNPPKFHLRVDEIVPLQDFILRRREKDRNQADWEIWINKEWYRSRLFADAGIKDFAWIPVASHFNEMSDYEIAYVPDLTEEQREAWCKVVMPQEANRKVVVMA